MSDEDELGIVALGGSGRAVIRSSLVSFGIDPGEYESRLGCGCWMVALEIDPVGPRLCLLVRTDDRPCPRSPELHALADFLPEPG